MSIHYRIQKDRLVIVGHTYPHKEMIKAIGGRFDGVEKAWVLIHSDQNLAVVDGLCRELGGGCINSTPANHAPRQEDVNASPRNVGLSIRELMQSIESTLTAGYPEAIWVVGEVQNLSIKSSGIFFHLSEEKQLGAAANATISVKATLWRSALKGFAGTADEDLELARIGLDEGMKIRVQCQVRFYQDRGNVSLNILQIDKNYSKGELALAREALMKELRLKGLDQKNKGLELSRFPLRIGLISAENSRAKSDFIDQLDLYGFPGEILFYPALMQGAKTEETVRAGLVLLSERQCDLIVITRGGGSAADLRWFDSKALAYAIAASPIPIVAAIGHHDDLCVAEEICYLRQKTPTAAADFVIDQLRQTKDSLDDMVANWSKTLRRILSVKSESLQRLQGEFSFSVGRFLERTYRYQSALAEQIVRLFDRLQQKYRESLLKIDHQLIICFTRYMDRSASELDALERSLIRKDPLPWLKQGWTQLFGERGVIKELSDVVEGNLIKARIVDGVLHLKVQEKEGRV